MTEDEGNDGRIKSVIELAREKQRELKMIREGEEPGKSRFGLALLFGDKGAGVMKVRSHGG